MASEEMDVLIVGGGPVGLTMAAELSYRGIKSIVVEKKTSTSVLAKAAYVSSRTMEHYRRLGLQQKVMDAAYPRDMSFNASVRTSVLGGSTMWRKKFASWGEIVDGIPGKTFLFYQPGASVAIPMVCPQTALEPVLKEHIEACSNVKTFWGWEVMSLAQDENGVTIRAVCSASSENDRSRNVMILNCLCHNGIIYQSNIAAGEHI